MLILSPKGSSHWKLPAIVITALQAKLMFTSPAHSADGVREINTAPPERFGAKRTRNLLELRVTPPNLFEQMLEVIYSTQEYRRGPSD
jgi:hypothetical protein